VGFVAVSPPSCRRLAPRPCPTRSRAAAWERQTRRIGRPTSRRSISSRQVLSLSAPRCAGHRSAGETGWFVRSTYPGHPQRGRGRPHHPPLAGTRPAAGVGRPPPEPPSPPGRARAGVTADSLRTGSSRGVRDRIGRAVGALSRDPRGDGLGAEDPGYDPTESQTDGVAPRGDIPRPGRRWSNIVESRRIEPFTSEHPRSAPHWYGAGTVDNHRCPSSNAGCPTGQRMTSGGGERRCTSFRCNTADISLDGPPE
jgi:hypothetical protein